MAQEDSGLSMPLCITDLLFNVIGFLILLIAISSFEEKMDSNEKVLEELRLTEVENISGLKSTTTSISINIFIDNDEPVIEIDGSRKTLETLSQYLNSIGGSTDIALRCDENVLVGFSNQVLSVCKRAGVENINQIVKITK